MTREETNTTTTTTTSTQESLVVHRPVVVVGNGPSGLSVSAFLSGWRPYYDLKHPHPNKEIHERFAAQADTSLFDQNLSDWPEGAGKLLDSLIRPDADLHHDHHSSVVWHQHGPHIPHLVVGEGENGGGWHTYPQDLFCVSRGNWFDLPGVGLEEWLNYKIMESRIPIFVVAQYFKYYQKFAQLDRKNFKTNCKVEELKHADQHWHLRIRNRQNQVTNVVADYVVLATGLTQPRKLNVPGEEGEHSAVLHTLTQLELLIQERRHNAAAAHSRPDDTTSPVLVVGDGLSAADAVMRCIQEGLPVLHSFRRSGREVRGTLLGRLSGEIYEDYRFVFGLMTGKKKHPLYTPLPATSVTRVDGNRVTLVSTTSAPPSTAAAAAEERVVEVECVVASVGRLASLPFMQPQSMLGFSGTQSRLNTDPHTYACVGSHLPPNIFAVGPLAGDNFVRYIVGGAMVAASNICKNLQP